MKSKYTKLETIGNIIDTPQDLLMALGSISERCRDLSDFCEQAGGRPVDKNAARKWRLTQYMFEEFSKTLEKNWGDKKDTL
jgi:hypothetical protein